MEYALIAGLIAVVIAVAVDAVGNNVKKSLQQRRLGLLSGGIIFARKIRALTVPLCCKHLSRMLQIVERSLRGVNHAATAQDFRRCSTDIPRLIC
ncbi:MAG: hypothetical protein ACREEN_11785, partial [Stellaceae bacterium]